MDGGWEMRRAVAAENWMSARWCALAGAGADARVRSLVAGAAG